MALQRSDNRLLHGWHRGQMKDTVAVVEQLLEQSAIPGIALDKFQVATRRAPGEMVERARAQVVQDDDLVAAPAQSFGQVRPNKSRSTCNQGLQRIARGGTSTFEPAMSVKKLAVEGTAVEKGKISNEPIMIQSDAISVEHEDASAFGIRPGRQAPARRETLIC